MRKNTLISILIGVVLGYALAITAINIFFVFKIVLCILALRYLFSELSYAD